MSDKDVTFNVKTSTDKVVEEKTDFEQKYISESKKLDKFKTDIKVDLVKLKENHEKQLTEAMDSVKIGEKVITLKEFNKMVESYVTKKITEAKTKERAEVLEIVKEDLIELNDITKAFVDTKLTEQKDSIYKDVFEDLEIMDSELYKTLKEDLLEIEEGMDTLISDDRVVKTEDEKEIVLDEEGNVINTVEEEKTYGAGEKPIEDINESSCGDEVKEDVMEKTKFNVYVKGEDGTEDVVTVTTYNEDRARGLVSGDIIKVEVDGAVTEGEDYDDIINQKNIDVDDVKDALSDLETDVNDLRDEDYQPEDFLTDIGMEDFGAEDFDFGEDFGVFDLEDGERDFLIESIKLGKVKSKPQLKALIESFGTHRMDVDLQFKMKKVFEKKEKAIVDKKIAENLEKKKITESVDTTVEVSEHDMFKNHFINQNYM